MKNYGWVITLVGAALGVYAFLFFDVTVPFDDDTRVVNIHLMSRQQNLLLIAAVLFIGGILLSRVSGKRKSRENIDHTNIDSIDESEYFINDDGICDINHLKVDELSLKLLKKYGSSSISDILLFSRPITDKICSRQPEVLGKKFRDELARRLKENY